MVWQQTPFTAPLALAAGLSAVVALLAIFRLRGTTTTVRWSLVGLSTAAAVWTAAYAVQLASADLPTKLLWARIAWLGLTGMLVAWPAFIIAYVGRSDWLSGRTLVSLSIVPAAWLAIVWTGAFGRLAVAELGLDTSGSFAVISVTPGPLMWGFVAYAYVVDLLAIAALGWLVVRTRGIHRRQAGAVLFAGSFPVAMNWLSVSGVLPYPAVDPTPLSFAVTTLIVAAAIFRYRLLEVGPVPRGSILDHLAVGLVVLDGRRRVVDISSVAAEYLNVDAPAALGEPAETVLDDYPDLLAALRDPARDVVELETTRGQYEARILQEVGFAGPNGLVLLLRDITEHKEREAALERQNDRLEEFATLITHDLRNPLNVAQAQLSLARADDGDHLDAVDRAHERMATIIDDVMELTRQGRTVEETEDVDLQAVVEAAWSNVSTGDAEVVIEESIDLAADTSRLAQLLENLFRNAVEHAGPDVTVRVGGDANGFYVEDDGPGVPPADREAVFEPGHSTGSEGIGMGLAIVREIGQAHGWEVTATEGRDGGARFEFAGVGARERSEPENVTRPVG